MADNDRLAAREKLEQLIQQTISLMAERGVPLPADVMTFGSVSNSAEMFIDVPDGIMISFKIDPAIGKLIKLSEGEPVRDMHISLALPGKVSEYSEDKLDRLTEVIRGLALISRALSGVITGPGEFAPHDGKKPVVLLVDVPGLPQWRQRLVDILDDNGFSIADNHGFIPHITLKYADADERVELDFDPINITFDRVSLKIGVNERSFKLGGGVGVGADSFAPCSGTRAGRSRPSSPASFR